MSSTKTITDYLLLFGSVAFFIVGCLFDFNNQNPYIFIADIILLISNGVYSIKADNKKWVFFIFQVTVFTFLMGQSLFCYIDGDFSVFELTQFELNMANLCIWISLFVIRISHAMTSRQVVKITFINRKNDINSQYTANSKYVLTIRKVSKLLFFITYAFLLYALIDKIQFVGSYSYIESYTVYSSPLTLIASRLSSVTIPALYVFLGTMPNKKDCKLPLILFAIYTILSLGTQVRNIFVVNTIMIFLYLIIREKREDGSTVWISKKVKILAILAVPVILIFLSMLEYVRVGNSFDASPIALIKEFFQNQGGSIRVIGFSERFRDSLLSFSHHYILGSITWIFKYNILTKFLFGISEPVVGTLSMAQHGNQLAHSLTYLYSPLGYANGYGIGSCYIAEGYVQYGYVGVVIVSIIVGIVCALIDKNLYREKGPIAFAIYFLVTAQLIYLPRASMGAMVSQVFTITNVIIFILLYFIATIRINDNYIGSK